MIQPIALGGVGTYTLPPAPMQGDRLVIFVTDFSMVTVIGNGNIITASGFQGPALGPLPNLVPITLYFSTVYGWLGS